MQPIALIAIRTKEEAAKYNLAKAITVIRGRQETKHFDNMRNNLDNDMPLTLNICRPNTKVATPFNKENNDNAT